MLTTAYIAIRLLFAFAVSEAHGLRAPPMAVPKVVLPALGCFRAGKKKQPTLAQK